MKNFKRVAALSLAGAMSLSMMAGASFEDSTEIKTTEAVDMLTTLGILKGFSDGTFRPTETVTRAEMAKIIYVIKNGGVDDEAKYYVNAVESFSDTKGHWAEGYINYARSAEIIAGVGNNKFLPDEEVTGLEAAKMILTILGYDAERAGLEGSSWAIKTASLASDKGLFDDYELGYGEAAERQYAAQIAYNGLFASTVKYVDGSFEDIHIEGDFTLMGEKYMGLATAEGVLMASNEYELGDVADSGEDRAVIKLSDDTLASFEHEEDVSDMLGQEVRVVADVENEKIYGIYPTEENTVINVTLNDVELDGDDTLDLGDKSYKFESSAKAFTGSGTEGVDFATEFASHNATGKDVTFISNDDDSAIELAIISNDEVAKVTGVYRSRITTTSTNFASIETDDSDIVVDIYDNIEEDDIIYISENLATGDILVEKMATVSGTVEASSADGIRINGEWYKLSTEALVGTTLPSIASDVTLHVKGEFVYAVTNEITTSDELAVVTAIMPTADINGNFEAKLLLSNNTEELVKVDSTLPVGTLVTYEVDGDVYEIAAASSSNLAGFDAYEDIVDGEFNASTDKIGSYHIDADATVFVSFVEDGKTEFKVISGTELMQIGSSFGENVKVLSENENGFNYAKAVLITTTSDIPSLKGEGSFGFILETPYVTGDSSDKEVIYTIFDGENEVEVSMDSSAVVGAKGDFISFDRVSDFEVDNVAVVGSTNFAITAYDENTKDIMFNGDSNIYRVTEDTAIIFVDSETNEIFEDGQIRLADKSDADVFINNATFVAETVAVDGVLELEFLAIDVNNEMK